MSKIHFNSGKFWDWYYYGGKVPRRVKKAFLGKRMSGSELRRKLKSVVIGDPVKTMFESPNITPDPFCPHCGNESYVGTGNRAEYPQHWEDFHCLRCRKVVAYIDNSPLIHALMCKEEGYNPVF